MSFGSWLTERARSRPAYPRRVVLWGRLYVRAFFRWPKAGVVAQYREERDRDAGHLLVLADGSYVGHVDRANPDRGVLLACLHFFWDVLGGAT